MRKAFGTAAVVMVAAMLLLWPAVFNTQPFFFPDTTAYVRGADAAVFKLTGVSSPWTKPPDTDTGDSVTPDKAVLAGRSIYYGALVYLGDRGRGEWLSIAIQAALLTSALCGTLWAFGIDRRRYLVALTASLALFTLVPLYASFLMPDIFTGIAILACGMLLTCDLRKHRAVQLGWFALLTLCLTFHTTHAILALLMLGLGALLHWRRRSLVEVHGLAAIGAALVVAYLCGAAFTVGVTRLMGEPPLTPPFLMARLIDDGPGYHYLKDTCPGNGFLVCRFVDRLPVQSDDFLWSKDPTKGVFATSDPAVRRGLSREQYRFALAVIVHEPLQQMAVSLRNAGEQAGLLNATEFAYTDEEKTTFAVKTPPATFAVMKLTPAFTGNMPIRTLSVLSYLSTGVGLVVLIVLFASGRYGRMTQSAQMKLLTGLVVFGVLANAAVCGVMSGPHDRYEARVAWLIPAMALIGSFRIHAPWWNRILRISRPT